jgi:LuxR family maltose regulon positive regulatory protein
MTEPLIETKLYTPRPRPNVVVRPRLSERLRRGSESRLTLISAPAGFGKTTLLTEWLTASGGDRAVAWLSLDHGDSRPATFWTYLIAALQTVAPGVGASAMPLLQSSDLPIETALTLLINELGTIPYDVALVLDDLHVVESPDVEEGLTFLLEHLPSRVHVVISTRADPRLPLARLRARGELVEIRAADLRFTHDEAAAYLDAVGLHLTSEDVALLGERTEGWIAALQLAGLSMQGRADVGGFIAGFAGNDRYIVDYLVDEVLQRQPEHVRAFLLSTSILERLNGSLCDAVTDRHASKAMLETLDHANLFVIPLDDVREWYRYHRLFADVLQAHLLETRPDDIAALHVRASAWHQQRGDVSEAVRHAMAAEDFDRAADLVEFAIPVMRRVRQEAVLSGWLKSLPAEVIRIRPVLSVGLAGALLASGEFEYVEARLQDAEGWLSPANGGGPAKAASEMVVANEEEFERLPAAIALYRAASAMARGNVPDTVTHAQLALDLSPEDDHLPRAAAAGLLGLAYWVTGDLEAGHRAWAECVAGLYRAGHVADTFGCSLGMADIRRVQGRLGDAMRTYEHALEVADAHGGPTLRGTADMYVGMSEICRERNDLPAATQHLQHSHELGEHLGLPQNAYRSRVAMARVREAEGDLSGALELLNDAERVYRGDFFPNVRPIPAVRARLWVVQGSLGAALGWVSEQGLSADDDLSYMREFEHVTLARVLLAQYTTAHDEAALHSATGLLQRLLAAAHEGGRSGTVIEILVLEALALHAVGAVSDALVTLERALALAEPQSYVRVFVDEGAPMASLLRAAAKEGIARTYVRRLQAVFTNTDADPRADQGLIEPLSERELEVLRLLATDLNGPEIARTLVVSLNTVRTHTKNIYTKLDVNDRRAAVRRATELHLLSR